MDSKKIVKWRLKWYLWITYIYDAWKKFRMINIYIYIYIYHEQYIEAKLICNSWKLISEMPYYISCQGYNILVNYLLIHMPSQSFLMYVASDSSIASNDSTSGIELIKGWCSMQLSMKSSSPSMFLKSFREIERTIDHLGTSWSST